MKPVVFDVVRARSVTEAARLLVEAEGSARIVLIDGQPARSCITYAALCNGAEITTIEGLENDPIIVGLRHAFSVEHGLQCGYCTPAMLISARDIILRLPDADEAQIRMELSGNLCRCTGYVGIVRAVCRAMRALRRDDFSSLVMRRFGLGPVGARLAGPTTQNGSATAYPPPETANAAIRGAAVSGALPMDAISWQAINVRVKAAIARFLRRFSR
jgi:aerobic carbon-monoxide dehydrogenase small subunit